MDYLDSLGDWLRQRREAFRLTRPELPDCAGCSVSALRKIEADERRRKPTSDLDHLPLLERQFCDGIQLQIGLCQNHLDFLDGIQVELRVFQ